MVAHMLPQGGRTRVGGGLRCCQRRNASFTVYGKGKGIGDTSMSTDQRRLDVLPSSKLFSF